MSNTEPPYYPIFIKFSPAIILISAVYVSYQKSTLLGVSLPANILTFLFIESAIIMKLAAPRIPLLQLGLLVLSLILLNIFTDYLIYQVSLVFYFVSDLLTKLLCVYCFGRYFVKKGYIPKRTNYWQ